MSESDRDHKGDIRNQTESEPEMVVNDYGRTMDPAVVVDETDRTILLTPEETVVFEKQPEIDIVPNTRPRTVYAGMWGRNEIATVSLGVFALLVVLLIYVFLVIPSNREITRHRSEAEALQFDETTEAQRYGSISNTESHVAKLLSSEQDFELNYLPSLATGRNALYQRLNGLIDAYGLVNTSGPDYSTLETLDQQNASSSDSDEERGRDRFRSLFPGIYVSMTVEGSYQNLRRFIREIESGQEFIVISAVQLEPSDNDRDATQPGTSPVVDDQTPTSPIDMRPASARGKTRGNVVSLHLEMAAYFRRPNFDAATAQ